MASKKDNRSALTALAIKRMKVGEQLADTGENAGSLLPSCAAC
jgi:cytochrome c553